MRRCLAAGLACCFVFGGIMVSAQEARAPLTWITFYKTQFGRGGEFVELLKLYDQPVWDRMVTEGVIEGWGIVEQYARTNDEWTHATWVAMSGYAAQSQIEKVWNEVLGGRSRQELKVEGDAIRSTLEVAGRDLLVRHLDYHSPTADSKEPELKLIWLSLWKAQPGKDGEVGGFYREYLRPVLERLAAEGVVTHYGFFAQDVHTETGWTHLLWYRVRDQSGFERVRMALEEANQQSLAQRKTTLQLAARDLFEPSSHRDMILRELVRKTH